MDLLMVQYVCIAETLCYMTLRLLIYSITRSIASRLRVPEMDEDRTSARAQYCTQTNIARDPGWGMTTTMRWGW